MVNKKEVVMEKNLTAALRNKMDMFREMYLYGVKEVIVSKELAEDIMSAHKVGLAYWLTDDNWKPIANEELDVKSLHKASFFGVLIRVEGMK